LSLTLLYYKDKHNKSIIFNYNDVDKIFSRCRLR